MLVSTLFFIHECLRIRPKLPHKYTPAMLKCGRADFRVHLHKSSQGTHSLLNVLTCLSWLLLLLGSGARLNFSPNNDISNALTNNDIFYYYFY